MTFHLTLFGQPTLWATDQAEQMRPVLGPGKPLLLLARLCLEPAGLSREQLAAFLWSDMPEERARASARQSLHVLRQVLGADTFETDRRNVRLRVPVDTDVAVFLAAIAAGDDARAAALYSGPLFGDLGLTDANEGDQWISLERARFRNLFTHSALRRIAQLRSEGALAEAVVLMQRVRDADPVTLAHWRGLLELLDDAGLAAQRRAEGGALRAMLEAGEFDEEPEVLRAARRLAARGEGHPEPILPTRERGVSAIYGWRGRFVGRRTELRALTDRWAQMVSSQRGDRLLVSGHAGIGKSRLLAEVARVLRSEGATVIWVRGRRSGRGDRYGLLTDVVAALTERPGSLGIMEESAAALVELVPALRSVFPGVSWHHQAGEAHQLIEALRDLLTTLAEERPMLVVMDDLHRADEASLAIIDAATSALDGVQVFVVGTARPRLVPMTSRWERMELGPLGSDQIGTLVADLEGVPLSSPVVDALNRITGGVPLQAVQALRLMVARGLVVQAPDAWQLAGTDAGEATGVRPEVPAISGRDLAGATIADRSSEARRVLGYLALADIALSREQIAGVLGRSADIDAVLRELEEADLAVVTSDDEWRVAHDIVADAVLYALPLEQRRALSLDLATRAVQSINARAMPATELRRVVRLFLDAEAPDAMLDAVVQWVDRTPNAPRGAALADLVLGPSVAPDIQRRMRRAVPERRRSIGLMLLPVATAVVLTLLSAAWWLRQPSRLDLVNVPVVTGRAGIPPIFEVHDRLGRLSNALDGDTVEAHIILGGTETGRIQRAEIRNGLVALNDLWLYETPGDVQRNPIVQIRTSVRRVPTSLITIRALERDSLWFESGMINGQSIDATQPTIRVSPRDSITGWVRVRFDSPHLGILIMMTQFSNWMPPASDTLSVASLITPAKQAFLYIPEIHYRAPDRPGTYWLTWTFTSEPAAVWIASSTSWRCGAPVWTDGNEKAESPPALLEAVWGHGGRIPFRRRLCDPGKPIEYDDSTVPAMSIRVLVE